MAIEDGWYIVLVSDGPDRRLPCCRGWRIALITDSASSAWDESSRQHRPGCENAVTILHHALWRQWSQDSPYWVGDTFVQCRDTQTIVETMHPETYWSMIHALASTALQDLDDRGLVKVRLRPPAELVSE